MHRRMLAEVALETHAADVSVGTVEALDFLPGSVRRAVVDEEQLIALTVQRCRRPAYELVDGRTLVVKRYDHGDLRLHGLDTTIGCPVAAASLEDRITELREDRSHGASWMARQAVEALIELVDEHEGSCENLLDELRQAGRRLAAARPGVGAIAGTVGRLLASSRYESHLEPDVLRQVVSEEAQALTEGRIRAPASIAIQLRERIDGATVLTHSNSATVREALSHDEPAKVLCTVSSPVEEGRTLLAELVDGGIDAELVEDADAPDRVKEVDVVLVGADTVFRDGTICNKIGTIPLARAAHDADVPVVVAAELIKLAPVPGAQAPDLADFERELFELIPADLITEVVTEEGAFAPDDVASLADRVPFLREGYELIAPLAANR